jgi:hypothetical protein
MRFSILRMLILVGFVCIWLGLGAISPLLNGPMMQDSVISSNPFFMYSIGAFITGLFVLVGFILLIILWSGLLLFLGLAWDLSGEMEQGVRRWLHQRQRPQ